MAGLPWHADGASCRSGYQRKISTVLPTFWPARIPTQVLSEADYRIVLDRSRPLAERQAGSGGVATGSGSSPGRRGPRPSHLMVDDWSKLGMVAERPGPGDPEFPQTFKVESYVGFNPSPSTSTARTCGSRRCLDRRGRAGG